MGPAVYLTCKFLALSFFELIISSEAADILLNEQSSATTSSIFSELVSPICLEAELLGDELTAFLTLASFAVF